jgi:hypothetical protein
LIKRIVAERGRRKVIAMDSISHVGADDAGHIVVSASHGGASAAEYAAPHKLAAAFFNDAGVGKDEAGIAALAMLERLQVPAGTVSHLSARIGDVEDMWQHGVLSHVNPSAARRGLKPGEPLQDAVNKLLID